MCIVPSALIVCFLTLHLSLDYPVSSSDRILFKDHVGRPLFINHQENRTIMAHLQQQQEIQNQNHQYLMQCVLKREHSVVNTVTPDKNPVSFWNGTPLHSQNQPVQFVSPAPTTLADGRTPRKRKAEVTQIVAISQEYKRRESA